MKFSGEVTESSRRHMINVSSRGNVYPVENKSFSYLFSEVNDIGERSSLSTDYNIQINNMLRKLRTSGTNEESQGGGGNKKKKIVIFIHGGLNTMEGSIARVNEHYKKIMDDNIYPIFVNWRSGGITTYGSHLFEIRDGVESSWAKPTSPLYFLSDLLSGVAIAPVAWTEQGSYSFADTFTLPQHVMSQFEPDDFQGKVKFPQKNAERPWSRATGSSALWWATSPAKLITTPFTYSFGKPAWDVMNRRARAMLFRSCEFTHNCTINGRAEEGEQRYGEYYREYELSGYLRNACLSRFKYEVEMYRRGETRTEDDDRKRYNYKMCSGALSILLSKLAASICKFEGEEDLKCKKDDYEVNIVGHSMGAIVIGEVLKNHSYFPFDNVVFMGGAISGRHAIDSLGYYMQLHEDTNFYNLSLHPLNERLESSGYGFLPSGSLLVWIDTMYGLPTNEFELTFGQWENARKQVAEFPPDIAKRMYFTVFGIGERSIIGPQKHGDFDNYRYWKNECWFNSVDDENNGACSSE